jgi:hypothetical protein
VSCRGLVGRDGRLDLLCSANSATSRSIDIAEPLLQIISEGQERAAIAVATNPPLSEWARCCLARDSSLQSPTASYFSA